MAPVKIQRTRFALAFQRFERCVEAHPDSSGPFSDFQHGLPKTWEEYKFGVLHKAQDLMRIRRWRKRSIGSGEILKTVIAAIEIKEWSGVRNNLVEWERKGRPLESVAHFKMLQSLESALTRRRADEALFRMYAEQGDPAECFTELTGLFGSRYDLIAYLFFIRDWSQYMPVRPTYFPQAFEILGVPLVMRSRCSWENYQQYLARLTEVLRHLRKMNLPGMVSLLDAHSFCWMLARLTSPPARSDEKMAKVITLHPEAGEAPGEIRGIGNGFTQEELDEVLSKHRTIGAAAQLIVLKAERAHLIKHGLRDLVERVRDVSDDTSLGYDIESLFDDGQFKRIEVKAAAVRDGDFRFFLSENERSKSQTLDGYIFALVTGVESDEPRIYEFDGRELPVDALYAVNYEVRLKNPRHQ